jgi:hypothetical protein
MNGCNDMATKLIQIQYFTSLPSMTCCFNLDDQLELPTFVLDSDTRLDTRLASCGRAMLDRFTSTARKVGNMMRLDLCPDTMCTIYPTGSEFHL